MPRISRLIVVVASVFLACTGSAREKWLYAKSDNFEMFSSASEKESRSTLIRLEQMRAFFLAAFPLRRAREPRSLVFLFGSDRAFTAYKPLYQGKPKDVGGYFVGGDDEVVMALTSDLDPDLLEDPGAIVMHEYVHLMLHTRGMNPPLWLNEGLAEVYSSFEVSDTEVEIGEPKELLLGYMQNTSLMPLKQLFAVTEESKDYNEESRAGTFYAESWALTHFLVCGADKSNLTKLNQFLTLMESSPGKTAENFKRAFGLDYGQMESQLRHYLDGGKYYRRRARLPISDLAQRLKFRPATDFERDMALLDLRWRARQPDDVAAQALALAQRDPTSPRPHELLAAVYLRSDKWEDAAAHWARAAELHSDNPYVYVQLARNALLHSSQTDELLSDALVAQLRAWLDQALQINPDSADALEMLALTEAHARKVRVTAVNQVQAGCGHIRDPLPTLYALAIIRGRAGDVKMCHQILDIILASDPPAELRSAAQQLRGAALPSKSPAATSAEAFSRVPDFKSSLQQEGNLAPTAQGLAYRLPPAGFNPAELEDFSPLGPQPAADDWEGVERDEQRAAKGDVNAMFILAVATAYGRGIAFDADATVQWLSKAAAAGHPDAKKILRSAANDPERAVRLLRKENPLAAGEGDVPPLESELKARINAAAKTGTAALALVYRCPPRYPLEFRKEGVAGKASISFVVDISGHPQEVKALDATRPAFGAAAEACVRQWRFIPTINHGKPVTSRVMVPITFYLSGNPTVGSP